MKLSLASLIVVAGTGLTACGPSADDESMMKEKMDLENQRATIMTSDAKDCTKMGSELKAFHDKNADRLKAVDDKWKALSKGTKDKLIEKNKSDWDKQTDAVATGGLACPKEFKAGFE